MEDGLRILVAAIEALEVEDADAAKLGEGGGGADVDDGIHGRGEDRKLELDASDFAGDIDVVGVERYRARDESYVVEAVGLTTLPSTTDLYVHSGNILLR